MFGFCKGPSGVGPAGGVEEAKTPRTPVKAVFSEASSGGARPDYLMVPGSGAQWRSEMSGASKHWEDRSDISKCTVASKRIDSKSRKEFNELYEIEKKVQVSGLSGPSGTMVHHARRISDGEGVTIKAVNKALAFEGCIRDELHWLKGVKAQLNWPKSEGICELLEVIQTDTHYYMVAEKFEGQDLWAWRSRAKVHFEHAIVRAIIKKILRAVKVMHDEGIIHRDLKLENIWVNVDKGYADPDSAVTVKLVDFDAATTSTKPESYLIGSHGYCAPETYTGHYSTASDMFAIGVVMYKLLTRRFPLCPTSFEVRLGEDSVGSTSMKRIHRQLQNAEIDFSLSPLNECHDASSLCAALLMVSPEDRITAEKALKHEWFTLNGNLPEFKQ